VPDFTTADLANWGWFFAYIGLGAIEVLPTDGYMASSKEVFPDMTTKWGEITVHYGAD
jgi:hypothetical protein